jgi:hypothetical protein
MNENKLTEQEHKELIHHHNQLNNLKLQLGDLYIQKKKIQELEDEINSSYKVVENSLIDIENKLTFKYGDIAVDMQTGTFSK